MKTAVEQLTKYATYHRDKRNIVTHFIGIPMIVFAVVILLGRPVFGTLAPSNSYLSWLVVSPALIVSVVACIYYLKLDHRLGLVMTLFLIVCLIYAAPLTLLPTAQWLMWGIGIFVVGWVLQFIGHFYEGKKPAFVDDIMGLIIGPLFVTAEVCFLLGLRSDLRTPIEAAAGVTRVNQRRVS
jgi:uncharacterized membrane protein YGL010W